METKPYFYVIKHVVSNKLYAGSKYGTGQNNKPNSSTFLTDTGYQTTSRIVKEIIKNEGVNSFVILKLRHFDTPEEAVDYEARFLKRVDAKNNPRFYNQNNADGGTFRNKGGYKLSDETKAKMRKPKSPEAKANIQAAKERRDCSACGKKAIETRRKNGNDKLSEEQRKKISERNQSYWTDDVSRKHSDLMKSYYEENPISLETRLKTSESVSGSKNPMFGKTQSESAKQKMKDAWLRRKQKSNTNL